MKRSSSSRANLIHELNESIEEIFIVVRPRSSFRVVLDRHHWEILVSQPLSGSVIEVQVAWLRPPAQSLRINRIAVVLGSDVNGARREVLYRVVRTVMSELEFVGLRTKCASQ